MYSISEWKLSNWAEILKLRMVCMKRIKSRTMITILSPLIHCYSLILTSLYCIFGSFDTNSSFFSFSPFPRSNSYLTSFLGDDLKLWILTGAGSSIGGSDTSSISISGCFSGFMDSWLFRYSGKYVLFSMSMNSLKYFFVPSSLPFWILFLKMVFLTKWTLFEALKHWFHG